MPDSEDVGLWAAAGTFAGLAMIVSLVSVFSHLCSFTRPLLQRSIVRILLIIPIYSLSSWLSLRYEKNAIYFDTVRDIYEVRPPRDLFFVP